MKYKIKKPSPTKKPVAMIVALVVVLLLLCGLVYRHQITKTADRQTSTDSENLDLSPPTDEEKAETEQHKENLSEQQNNPSTTPTDGKAQVIPIITSATRAEVRAYVTGVVEEGGTCTATAIQGDQVKTGSSTGFDNVSNTQCTPITMDLGPGTWSVTVSYVSSKAQGTSQPTEVK